MGRAGLFNLLIIIKYLGEPAPTKIILIKKEARGLMQALASKKPLNF